MSRLVLHQARFDLTLFRRNPQSRFFTLALPLILLLIFLEVFGDTYQAFEGTKIKMSVYYLPGMIVLGIVSACLVNLVVSLVALRERGILKRRRSTPVPATVLIAGRALTAVILSLAILVILLTVADLAYGVEVPWSRVPYILGVVILGSVSLCCVGYALASFVPSEESSIPITQLVVLPLYFISGIFIHEALLPNLFVDIADVMPVRHLDKALLHAFFPEGPGPAPGVHLAVIAAWGLVGLVVAVRRFQWAPNTA